MIHKLISRKKMESSRGIRRKVDALKITKTKTESKIPMIIILIQVDRKRRRRKKKEKESRSPSRPRQLPQPLHPPSLRIKGRWRKSRFWILTNRSQKQKQKERVNKRNRKKRLKLKQLLVAPLILRKMEGAGIRLTWPLCSCKETRSERAPKLSRRQYK